MKVLELFGGIGACTQALKRIGMDVEVADYVEIDKYACASYNAINGTNFEPQDICTWDKNIEVDLIMHGSPCQDFSVAGKQAGGDVGSGTRSSLMYETIRIVGKLRPKYVVWENVKNLLSTKHRHNFDAYLETMKALGYSNYYQVLNAKDYGIPQNRERVFTISIRKDVDVGYEFPEKQPLEIRLKDVLEDEVAEKYYLSNAMLKYAFNLEKEAKGIGFSDGVDRSYLNPDIAQTIGCRSAVSQRSGTTNYVTDDKVKRKVADIKGCIQIGTLDIKGMDCIKRVYSDEGLSPTLTDMQGGNRQPKVEVNTRVRKLTPKECWRLMGFADESFEKAAEVCSNTQLYKQAGNSIVVNVLEEIFKKLF